MTQQQLAELLRTHRNAQQLAREHDLAFGDTLVAVTRNKVRDAIATIKTQQ